MLRWWIEDALQAFRVAWRRRDLEDWRFAWLQWALTAPYAPERGPRPRAPEPPGWMRRIVGG